MKNAKRKIDEERQDHHHDGHPSLRIVIINSIKGLILRFLFWNENEEMQNKESERRIMFAIESLDKSIQRLEHIHGSIGENRSHNDNSNNINKRK